MTKLVTQGRTTPTWEGTITIQEKTTTSSVPNNLRQKRTGLSITWLTGQRYGNADTLWIVGASAACVLAVVCVCAIIVVHVLSEFYLLQLSVCTIIHVFPSIWMPVYTFISWYNDRPYIPIGIAGSASWLPQCSPYPCLSMLCYEPVNALHCSTVKLTTCSASLPVCFLMEDYGHFFTLLSALAPVS